MAVWWRYVDIVEALGAAEADLSSIKKDLLRSLAAGRITASADLVVNSEGPNLVRREHVTIPASYWVESRTLFAGAKKALSFRPELNKLFNPRAAGSSLEDAAAVDCFGLMYLAEDVRREFSISADRQPAQRTKTSRGAGNVAGKTAWSQFAAALAVVAAKGDQGVEPGLSAASIYEEVAVVLQARLGADAAYFGIDNVRDAITLAQEWMPKGMAE